MRKLINKLKFLEKDSIEIIGIYIYYLILQLAYIIVYNHNGEFITGFIENYNIVKSISAYIVISCIFVGNQKIENDFIRFYNKIFIYVMLVPISAIYAIRDWSTLSYVCFVLEFVIIIYGLKALDKINKKKLNMYIKEKLQKINFSNIIYILFWISTFLVIIFCFKYNGLPKLTALNLYKVYEVRENFYLPKYIQYLYDFATKFMIIFLMVVNLHKKRYKTVGLAVAIQLLFYLWKGDKTVLIACPLVIFVYIFLKKLDYKRYLDKNIIWIIVYACIAVVILELIGISLPLSLLITRVLFIPANLKFVYMDFFSTHSQIGIVGTIFNSFLKLNNPYSELPYQNIISDIYFNKPEMYSNTGMLVEGFARWGYVGFLIIPIIYIIVLKVLEHGAKNTSFAFIVSISLIPIITLNDGFLIPSLTFGAIGLLCFVSLFFRIDELNIFKLKNKEEKNE